MKEELKRATVYLQSELHRALRIKAAHRELSISEQVNDAIKLSLREDAIDLSAFGERADEKSMSFETVLHNLKAGGKL